MRLGNCLVLGVPTSSGGSGGSCPFEASDPGCDTQSSERESSQADAMVARGGFIREYGMTVLQMQSAQAGLAIVDLGVLYRVFEAEMLFSFGASFRMRAGRCNSKKGSEHPICNSIMCPWMHEDRL